MLRTDVKRDAFVKGAQVAVINCMFVNLEGSQTQRSNLQSNDYDLIGSGHGKEKDSLCDDLYNYYLSAMGLTRAEQADVNALCQREGTQTAMA